MQADNQEELIMGQIGIIIVYVIALGALMYFFAIKPQKKQ